MENKETRQPVTTIEPLHEARGVLIYDGLKTTCIQRLHLNCQHQRDGMVFRSLGFMPDRAKYGNDNGFKAALRKDHVVSFTGGNPMNHIFYFDEQRAYSVCFGLPLERN